MKSVMILGAGMSEIPVIQSAIAMGHKAVVVDQDKHSPGFTIGGVIKEYSSIADKEKILELAQKYQINGILASVDAGVRSTAYVSTKMNLPGISEEAAFMGTNKTAMRLRLKERGVPVPEFYIVKSKDAYTEALLNFENRCVVKAADSSGSRGIYMLKDLKNAEEIDFAYDYCIGFSGTGQLLIEECMEGLEICVETLNSSGICHPIQITDQMHKEPPYFTDCGYSQPSILNRDMQEEIYKIAINANMAVENYQGSSCTEMIVTSEGPKVVEIGVRLAGDFMTTRMVPLSTGVDMPGNVVKIALGEPIDVTPSFNKGSCVRYFMRERVGKIKNIIGLDRAKKVEGIQEVGILKGIGMEATPLRKSSDRLGYVIAQMDTAEAAVKAAETALAMIDFIVEA